MSGRLSAPATLSRSGGLVGGVFGAQVFGLGAHLLHAATLEATTAAFLHKRPSSAAAMDEKSIRRSFYWLT